MEDEINLLKKQIEAARIELRELHGEQIETAQSYSQTD